MMAMMNNHNMMRMVVMVVVMMMVMVMMIVMVMVVVMMMVMMIVMVTRQLHYVHPLLTCTLFLFSSPVTALCVPQGAVIAGSIDQHVQTS